MIKISKEELVQLTLVKINFCLCFPKIYFFYLLYIFGRFFSGMLAAFTFGEFLNF